MSFQPNGNLHDKVYASVETEKFLKNVRKKL